MVELGNLGGLFEAFGIPSNTGLRTITGLVYNTELCAYTTWGNRVCAWSYNTGASRPMYDYNLETGEIIEITKRTGTSSTSFHRSDQIYKPSYDSPISYIHYGQSTSIALLDAQMSTVTNPSSSLSAYVYTYGEDGMLYSFIISSSNLVVKKAAVGDLASSTTVANVPTSSMGSVSIVYAGCYIGNNNIFLLCVGSDRTKYYSFIFNTTTNTVSNLSIGNTIQSLVGSRYGVNDLISGLPGKAYKFNDDKIYIRTLCEEGMPIAWYVYDMTKNTLAVAANGRITGNSNYGYRTVCDNGKYVIVGATRENASMEITSFV